MNLIPILIISLILLIITILLIIADRLLVNYGRCKITVHQEDTEREFEVDGGGYLMRSLIDNGIKISSSCGGKGTCGYCKVIILNGGGQILPTEEIFMSREEKLNNTRLACQVKIKNDIEIYIPDYINTVKNIVKNKLFDPKLRWRWIRTDLNIPAPEMMTSRVKLHEEDEIKLISIIEKYKETPGAVVPILQEINNNFNYLSEPVLRFASDKLKMPLSTILRIATFYDYFSLKPRGKYVITVCLGTSCYLNGSKAILSALEKELRIKSSETTKDMLFTLDTVRCIGYCALAPVLKANKDVHGLMNEKKMLDLIEELSCKP